MSAAMSTRWGSSCTSYSPDACLIRQPLPSSGGARIWSLLPHSLVGGQGHRSGRRKSHPALSAERSRAASVFSTSGSGRISGRRPARRRARGRRNAISGDGRRFGGNRRPASSGGLGFAGRSHRGGRCSDSAECTNHALPARAARKTTGGACRTHAGNSAEYWLFRAAGGHRDWILRGERVLRYIREHDKSKTRWDHLETGAFVFWYRGSPRPLAAGNIFSPRPLAGMVWTDDPPLDVSGMTLVELNPLGRLTHFIAIPPQVESPAGLAPSPDWGLLFSAAGSIPPSGRQHSRPGRLLFIATPGLRGRINRRARRYPDAD